MSRWSEREIARKLAERDELEPPAGLLEKIKSEIPPEIPVGTGVPEAGRRPSMMPPRQRWLMAASVAATVGAGLFALHLQREVPPVQEAARVASGLRQPASRRAVPPPPPPAVPPPAVRAVPRALARVREAPAPKTLSRRDEEKKLKSLGYVSSKAEGRIEGGIVGGIVAGTPAAPAPAPAPPPAAPAEMAEVQAPAAEPATGKDKKERAAEAPLLDERRRAGADQPSRDPWAALQSAPGVVTDRINVGGNESGQQSAYTGPGAAAPRQEAAKPQPPAKAAVGPEPFVEAERFRSSTFGSNSGTASYETLRRSLLKGRLPEAETVRVGEVLNGFVTGEAPPVEGAFSPFLYGPRYRLLRLHPAGGGQAQVEFNPKVVVRWRLLGSGLSSLYEIELWTATPRDNHVATLRLGGTERRVTLSEISVSWDKTTPGFRLAALSAQFAELLRSQPADPNALFRLLRGVRGEAPKSARLTELEDLVERAALIRVKK